MKITYYITILTLIFVGQACKQEKKTNAVEPQSVIVPTTEEASVSEDTEDTGETSVSEPEDDGILPYYSCHYKNSSNYTINAVEYRKSREWRLFDIKSKSTVTKTYGPSPYCRLSEGDSLRVYFNRNQPDERYVTYKKKEFNPRDIKNDKEYDIDRTDWDRIQAIYFYYTFTNEDYDNARENQNAAPTPIPPCSIERPGKIKYDYCHTETQGEVCYDPH